MSTEKEPTVTTLYRHKPGKKPEIRKIEEKDIDDEVDYPSEYYKDHPYKHKVEQKVKDFVWDDLKWKFLKKLTQGKLTVDEAISYLIYFAKTRMSVTSIQDLESFSIQIWKKNESVSPLNILDIKMSDNPIDFSGSDEEKMDQVDESLVQVRIVLHILCMYRLANINRQDYRNVVIAKMREVFCGNAHDFPVTFHSNAMSYSSWINNRNFTRLIAAYDMFLNVQGTNSEFQYLRIGTLSSYYKDCAALVAYERICSTLGFKPLSLIAHWMFVPGVADALDRLTMIGNEQTKKHSMFPYSREFGAMRKSPFSTRVNPEFHVFIHTVGALAGEKWSKTAILFDSKNIHNCCLNAIILAYANDHKADLGIQFTKTEDELPKTPNLNDDLVVQAGLKSCKEPEDFCNWIKANVGDAIQEIRSYVSSKLRDVTNPREDSIVKHLKAAYT